METSMHKILSAVAPLICVPASIAVLRAAQLPFPAELAWHALPQWLVFASLVYTSSELVRVIVGRALGAPRATPQQTLDA